MTPLGSLAVSRSEDAGPYSCCSRSLIFRKPVFVPEVLLLASVPEGAVSLVSPSPVSVTVILSPWSARLAETEIWPPFSQGSRPWVMAFSTRG